ncbi:MAG: hypothetical protein M3487_01085 [Actinomycetota bacterium]|nr:hypothetical protein [Acidimicrobiia bacterium]MDQ3468362.1 hypothetical protein [Actinomycetota bacterium]
MAIDLDRHVAATPAVKGEPDEFSERTAEGLRPVAGERGGSPMQVSR